MPQRTFASDNNAPVAPEILQAIVEANAGDAVAYGRDEWTEAALQKLRSIFGEPCDPLLVFNGTGANVVALSAILQPYEAVVCPSSAHLRVDECGALERFCGCSVLPVRAPDGKLRPEDLESYASAARDEHNALVRCVSISQSTEVGTIYTLEEVRAVCDFAHDRGWYVHMDGARLANACAALGTGLRESTRDLGVDVLTFGGTKNGLLAGEAVIFFDPALHRDGAARVRKQAMQLASKLRFLSAQFCALLENDRWRQYALHANAMARLLERQIKAIPGVRVTRPVEGNAVFASLDRRAIDTIRKSYYFHTYDESVPEVRWMTHHATRPEDVAGFARVIREALR